jgi:hypothetical protein
MIKKILALSILILAPAFSSAHEIKHVGTFDILLHRDPEDDPIARDPAQLYFSVTDSREKFKFADCDCRVAIRLGDQSLVDRKLTPEDEAPDWGENVSRVEYVFPKRGLYVVTIEGASKSNFYEPFRLDYDVRVERESTTVPPPREPSAIERYLQNPYAIGGVLVLFAIIMYTTFKKPRKKNK